MSTQRNKLLSLLKSNSQERFINKSRSDFEPKSYLEDGLSLIRFLAVFMLACHGVSALLSSAWFIGFYSQILPSTISRQTIAITSYITAAISVLLVETGKARSLRASFVNWYKHSTLSLSSVIALIFVVSSLVLSYFGGGEIGVKFTPTKATQDVNKLMEFYGNQIDAANQQLQNLHEKPLYKWKGRLTEKGTAAERDYRGIVAVLTSEMNAAIKDAQQSNNIITTANEKKQGNYSLSAAIVAAVIDIINLFLYGFCVRFRYLVYLENEDYQEGSTTTTTTTKKRPSSTDGGNKAPQQQAGFKLSYKDGKNGENGKGVSMSILGRGYQIECVQCGKTALKKSSRAKFCDRSCKREYHKNKGSLPSGV